MSVLQSDLPPAYSTLDLSPEDVANKPSAPPIDLLPSYSTIYESPEVAIAVDVNQGPLIEQLLEDNHHLNQSSSSTTRSTLTKKVISIIFVQLVAVGLVYGIFIYHGIVIRHDLMLMALVITFVPIYAMSCCKSMRQASAMNIIFLGLFTTAESFLLGAAVSSGDSKETLMAAGITLGILLVLVLIAFQMSHYCK